MRAVAQRAIDPARLVEAFPHRIHLVERAGGTRGEHVDVAFLIGGGQMLRRRPVVGDLVVVPLHEDRHFGVEGAHIVVEKVIFVRRAELVERLGNLRFLRDGEFFQTLLSGSFTSDEMMPSA